MRSSFLTPRWRGVDSNFQFRARSAEMGTFSPPIDSDFQRNGAPFGQLLRRVSGWAHLCLRQAPNRAIRQLISRVDHRARRLDKSGLRTCARRRMIEVGRAMGRFPAGVERWV
jgi:hypothetical protein